MVVCKEEQLSICWGYSLCTSSRPALGRLLIASRAVGGVTWDGGTWDMPHSEAYQLPGKYASCVAQTSAHSFPKIHFLQGSLQSIDVTVTRQQEDLWSAPCEHCTRYAADGKGLTRNSVHIKSVAMFIMFPLWSSVLFLSSNCPRLPAAAFWHRRHQVKVLMWQILQLSSCWSFTLRCIKV